ncbi:GIP, partial [Symbiodinium sp. CCMP2592]
MQQHGQQTAATASAANIAADGSVIFRSLSQVVLPAELVSRLQALQGLELGQLADLDHIRQGMQALADELVRRSELLGQCVQRAAEGTLEDRRNLQSLHHSMQTLQQNDAHHQNKVASLISEHERTMKLLAEFEVGMKSKWAETAQRTTSLEERFETFLAAQTGLRGDLESRVGQSAGEQQELLVGMLERQATALEHATAKQARHEEQIEQLRQSLDRTQSEAARVREKYEDDLKTTRWVVDRVTRLEMLVEELRTKDAAIRRELEIDPEQGVRWAAAGNDADSTAPPVAHHVLSPEKPGNIHEGYEEEWWGTGNALEPQETRPGERGYFQWDAFGASRPPGLGPSVPPPPLHESMKRENPTREAKTPQTAFKLLKDAPKLDLSAGGEPWEVGMTVHQWRVETRTVMTAIHPIFAEYFDKIYDQGRQRYEAKRLTGLEEPVPEILESEAEMETRLSLNLLKNLPLAVRQPVVEGSMSKNVLCILMLESLHERYAPGGREELESIQRYMRQLPAAQDFKGAMMTLRRWKLAKQRAQGLGLPEQAPNEGIAALDGLMRTLEKRHQQLGMRINILRMQPDIVIPTSTGLDRYVSLLEVECRRLAADQEIRDARTAQSSEVVVAAEAAEKGKGQGRLCFFHLKPGSEGGSDLSDAGPAPSSGTTNLESEPESDESGERERPPLWYLVLHETEYALLSNGPFQLLTHAIAPFQQVNGPNLIAVGIWQILEELDFQLPIEDLQIGLNQYIIEAHQTLCMYEDGALRPVVLVHVIDMDTNREQMLALTESGIPPRIERWTIEDARRGMRLQAFSGAEVMAFREESDRAKGAPKAKAPTVSSPPKYPGSLPEGPPAKASGSVPRGSSAEASGSVPRGSSAEASGPVPKGPSASIMHLAKSPPAKASTSGSQGSHSRAHFAEGKDRPQVMATRACFGPKVLVDSGANEVIRPRPEGFAVYKCRRSQVAMASGDVVNAWRTRDGELMIGEEDVDNSVDWILSVRRLRGIRGAFVWDELGPRVKYFDGETVVTVHCFEQNGLPYMSWEDFKPIRVQLARDWRDKGNARVMKVEDGALKILDYMSTADAVGGARALEVSEATLTKSIEDAGERRAEELCAKARVTYDEVWSAVQLASLVERRSDRSKQLESGEAHALPMWTFGLFVHGGVLGLTSETRRHPWLVKLLCKLVRQQHPDLEFLSVTVAVNLVFRPHKDRNSLERESVVLGLTRFQGGQIWIEGIPGERGNNAIRHIDNEGEARAGRLHELSHKSVRFNAAVRTHGTEPFQGVRGVAIAYTPRGHLNVSDEQLKELCGLGFFDERLQQFQSKASNIRHGSCRLEAELKQDSNRLEAELKHGNSKLEAELKHCNGRLEAESEFSNASETSNDNQIPQIPSTELSQGSLEDDVVQGEPYGESGLQDFRDFSVQGLGTSSVQSPDDDEGSRAEGVMAFEAVAEEVIDLETPRERPGHSLKDYEARGLRRPHRRVTADQISKGVLSIDLAGPYVAAYDGTKYALVAVFRIDESTQLHFMRPMKRRLWGEMFAALQRQHAEQGLPFVAHVCADSHFEEEPVSMIPAVQEQSVKGGEKGDRYKILSYEAEQEMNRAEVKVAQLVTDTIDARILSDPRTPADEKLKWVNEGLRSELETLQKKEIYDEWDEAEVPPGAKILPAKVVLTKKPLQDDTEVDPTDPLSTWRAKARIVVCGNYEQNTFGHDPDNASANPAIEHIRWSAACLADNPGWTGLVLDITELDGKMFKNAEGVMFVLDPISSGVWAIRKQGEPQSFCGIFDMYVDDGLIVGPVGLCTGLAEVLLTTWQMKIQGFLPSDDLKDGEKVMIGDKQVAVREELQFLGMVIKRTKDGVALHQRPWVDTELERRGWTTVRGAANLPEVVEGQTEPVPRDDAYGDDLHRAQSE